MPTQTAVFTRRVEDHMGPAPVCVPPNASCRELVELLEDNGASSALIMNDDVTLGGIITERDVARRVAFRLSPDASVVDASTSPVEVVRSDDYLFQAIARMRKAKLRHMPVVDGTGRPVGVLTLDAALAAATEPIIEQIENLTHHETLEGMRNTKSAQTALAKHLFQDKTPAPSVQRLLTEINNDLYRRIVELCMRQMADEGCGGPPVRYEVIVMGSGGRGENFLKPDQDNGFILEDYPDEQHSQIDGWFIELAERMTKALNEVGFEYCRGHVMATNPLWRKTLSQWKNQIDHWVSKGAGTVLRLCDIFFDYVPVYGDGALSAALRQHVTRAARRNFFLREMYKVDEAHGVALGFFGRRLLVDREPGPNQGKVNLKMTGTLPLVGAVRLCALREGIADTSTQTRLHKLREMGILSRDEYDYLNGAYTHITNLMLRQQVTDFAAGREVGKHVDPDILTERETDMLVDGFKAIRRFRSRVRTELTAEIF